MCANDSSGVLRIVHIMMSGKLLFMRLDYRTPYFLTLFHLQREMMLMTIASGAAAREIPWCCKLQSHKKKNYGI